MADWNTACLDWERRLLEGRSLVPELPLFEDQRARGLRIFKRLRVPDMRGLPMMGDVAGPWLFPIVEAIFGSYDPILQRRMIQEFFLLMPKKNGKTSTGASIMVDALIINNRPEGEFVLIAPTKEIAGIAFKQARGTIKVDPELDKLFQVQDHLKTITHRRMGSTLQVKAADTDVITGGKQVGTLIDELHVLASKSNAADILVELRGALAARPDGFLIIITTQSKAPPRGVFKSELQKARDVRDGKLQLPLLPVLYELPLHLAKDDGWKKRTFWPLVNPNLGRSVDEAFLERELVSAVSEGKAQLALFASQHFNVEIGLALSADAWPGAEFWEQNAEAGLTLAEIVERSDVVTMGVDGGGLDDLLGVGVVGRDKETRKWLSWCHAFAHNSVLERRKGEASNLRDFEADGDLEIVKRMSEAFESVADIAEEIDQAGVLASVGLDPYGVAEIVEAMKLRGIEGDDRIVGVSQGYKLTGTIKMAEVKLADGNLRHCGAPMMAWCVGNAKVEPKGNAIVVTKQASGSAKIDPLMALFNAVALMSQNPEPLGGRSVYEDGHNLLVI
ncbi:terminase large subunit [Methylocella tundrae]|nr:terminase TerL endonuclease subunit [Methylocella tundrae]